ncbi:endo alpha-1,4 polygalactosaminidase [Streptomyces sp. AA1529]|uniref:endo alpha-1,4 polygalactosaminidase n=1 Tax=Streptomyces sp. AA1529 TaxID=1203257 RepID=UPI00031DDC71|nr:endo alpha-1,4 polygalactosaminidase [Streptomyces sp. AA1529]
MRHDRRRPYRALAAAAAAAALLLAAAQANSTPAAAGTGPASPAGDVTLPPAHAGFDYQIGGPYAPPEGVGVVSRDHSAQPAEGLYNICYVNAFQTQPGAAESWDSDLLLRDASGEVVYDAAWEGEAFLDLRTAGKRERIAERVGAWIDSCAAKGFQAVEPDNFDSYQRSAGLLTAAQAQDLVHRLSDRAHARGLAIGQKNTAELAGAREANGLDFAVAEECGEWDECDSYLRAFGDRVFVIEYTADGLADACAGWGDRLSIVRRDLDVRTPAEDGYVRETC